MISHTLYWHPGGLKITYESEMAGDFIHIADLNPEQHIRFRLEPRELLVLGLRCFWRAFVR
jgi:hypothetical protein